MSSVIQEPLSGRLSDHIGLGVLAARFDRDLLEEVLNRTGRREKRTRRLPAHVMMRFVIAMGLFFDESYDEVMRRLVGNLRRLGSWDDDWQVPTKSAITQARQRLGAEPMRELFERAAVPLAGPGSKGAWLGRRRLMAIDATSFDVADTEANVERFGRMNSGPKASAYPKLHAAALVECGTHAIVGAVMDGCRTGERTLAAELVTEVGPGMLVMADAGLFSYDMFTAYAQAGADLAWRVGATVSIGHVRWLPDGSYLALIYPRGMHAERRVRLAEHVKAGGQLTDDLARLVRVVEYTVPERKPGGDLICVVTTITDPHDIPALELAAAYHQRWEEESAFDELKTDLRGRGQVLRSQTPELIEQQFWGLLLAHYAIRGLLQDAADPAGYDPDRMSFIKGLRVTRRQVTDQAAITP